MLKRGGVCYCSRGVLVQELLPEWVAIQGGGSGRRWKGNEGWRRLGGDRAQVSVTIHWRDKNHPLSPAWIWADKASHPSRQISRMGEDSLFPGVFIPIIRPNNGTKTCWGLLWCQAQLWSWIHLMSPQEIPTAWCSNKSTTPAWRGTQWISYTFSISAIPIRFCSHCPCIQGKQKPAEVETALLCGWDCLTLEFTLTCHFIASPRQLWGQSTINTKHTTIPQHKLGRTWCHLQVDLWVTLMPAPNPFQRCNLPVHLHPNQPLSTFSSGSQAVTHTPCSYMARIKASLWFWSLVTAIPPEKSGSTWVHLFSDIHAGLCTGTTAV